MGVAGGALYGAAGLGMIIPLNAFDTAMWFNIAGACMALAVFLIERNTTRRAALTQGNPT